MRLATRSVGRELNLEIHYPRPVGYEPPKTPKKSEKATAPRGSLAVGAATGAGGPISAAASVAATAGEGSRPAAPEGASGVEPDFMMTSPDSWKEAQPFPMRGKPLLPSSDKRGPFSIGVAVESPLPAEWLDGQPSADTPRTVRVAAIGHGGWLTGPELAPAKEKLLQDVSNWLLRRDELFARDDQPWSFPRLELTPRVQGMWEWAMRLGLPVLFVYVGVVVFMVRRLR
jgi:hypothetical protein